MNLVRDSFISYLNLDHRVDRAQHMRDELSRIGLPAERTRGGRVYEGPEMYAPHRIRASSTPGSEGCSIGQLAIMQEALRRSKHAWVMEDDLIFCSDFLDRLKIIDRFLEGHPWDVFWFGATFHVNPAVWHKDTLGRDVERTENPRIMRTYGCWSTYCYVVNKQSLEGIIDWHFASLPESIGIDTTFIGMQPKLQTFSFVPGCVKQMDGPSDIGNGMTIFSGFASLGPYWWADRMEEFDPAGFDWAEAACR